MFGLSETEEDAGEPHGHQQFEGDFFGDGYAPADLGWEDEGDEEDEFEFEVVEREESVGEVEPSNDEDNASNIDDEGAAWEPPAQPVEENIQAPAPSKDIEMANKDGQQARNIAEHETCRQPIIVRYRRKRAGEVLSRTENQYKTYRKGLASSEDNRYAPFTSRLDWEFAKWAKTRGPGSTAVTELLQIKGVSYSPDNRDALF